MISFCSQKLNYSSTLKNKTYIVWFKWNQSVEFWVQTDDFTWLKWNQSIEKQFNWLNTFIPETIYNKPLNLLKPILTN